MMAFAFSKDNSGYYTENGLEGTRMGASKLLQRSRYAVLAYTRVDLEKCTD